MIPVSLPTLPFTRNIPYLTVSIGHSCRAFKAGIGLGHAAKPIISDTQIVPGTSRSMPHMSRGFEAMRCVGIVAMVQRSNTYAFYFLFRE